MLLHHETELYSPSRRRQVALSNLFSNRETRSIEHTHTHTLAMSITISTFASLCSQRRRVQAVLSRLARADRFFRRCSDCFRPLALNVEDNLSVPPTIITITTTTIVVRSASFAAIHIGMSAVPSILYHVDPIAFFQQPSR